MLRAAYFAPRKSGRFPGFLCAHSRPWKCRSGVACDLHKSRAKSGFFAILQAFFDSLIVPREEGYFGDRECLQTVQNKALFSGLIGPVDSPHLIDSHVPAAFPQKPRPPEGGPYSAHIPALDGVRGLAVLGVMGSHLFPGTTRNIVTKIIGGTLGFGATGVDVFFCLSGFLITGILYDSLAERAFFRKFYARRVLRIFPLYYGVLFCFLLTGLFLSKRYHLELLSLALYLQNTSWIAPAIWNYSGPPPLPLAHFWSLAVEEQFYLIWPVVVFLLRRRESILAVSVATIAIGPLVRFALSMHGVPYLAINAGTICRADSLLGGAALAMLLRGPAHDRTLRSAPWLLALGGVVFFSCWNYVGGNQAAANALQAASLAFRYTGLITASVGLLALAMRPGIVQRMFSIRSMRWLGKYSYGLYVLHFILFNLLDPPLRAMVRHFTVSKMAGVLLPGLSVFGISLLAAYLSYQLYEKRFLRLKRYFDYDRA